MSCYKSLLKFIPFQSYNTIFNCIGTHLTVLDTVVSAILSFISLFNPIQASHNLMERSFWYCKIELVSLDVLFICMVSNWLYRLCNMYHWTKIGECSDHYFSLLPWSILAHTLKLNPSLGTRKTYASLELFLKVIRTFTWVFLCTYIWMNVKMASIHLMVCHHDSHVKEHIKIDFMIQKKRESGY